MEIIEETDEYKIIEITETTKKRFKVNKWVTRKYIGKIITPLDKPYKVSEI